MPRKRAIDRCRSVVIGRQKLQTHPSADERGASGGLGREPTAEAAERVPTAPTLTAALNASREG